MKPPRSLPKLFRKSQIPLEVLSAELITRTVTASKKFAELIFDINVSNWRRQVAASRDDILRSLVAASQGPFRFERWQRVVSYRHSHAPLSCLGSVINEAGGRFNYGGFDPLNSPPFPALYLAEDRETAWSERYGYKLAAPVALTREELALTRTESVTYLSVSGVVERILDLREPQRLGSFVAIVKGFTVAPDLMARARALKMSPTFVRDVDALLDALVDKDWRFFPIGFDVPALSQQFGQLVLAAGIEGIIFPSTRAGKGRCCLALFPANFADGGSEVKIDDRPPTGATHTRLAPDTYRDFLDR